MHHPTGTTRRALALLVALTVGGAAWTVPTPVTAATAPTPPPTATAAARAAADWLAARVGPDGAVPSAADPSRPSYVDTREVALALAAVGTHPEVLDRATEWLATHLADAAAAGDLTDSTGADQPGRLAQLILLAVATGRNPRAFGGTGATGDLVARLVATERTTGADAGLFGAQFPLYDGAYRQGLALAALAAVGVEAPRASAWLRAQQCDDGSWMAYRADLTAPCAFDPETFTGPDTNSTALAVIGLRAACTDPRRDVAAFARSAQGPAGGWSFGGVATEDPDPNSTALMISALVALGVAPTAPTASGTTATDALLGFAFTEGDDAGAFWFPPFGEGPRVPNLLATAQAATALVYRSAAAVPATPCPTPTTTTTSTSTTTTTTSAPGATTSTSTSTAPSTTTTTVAVAGRTETRAAAGATAVAASPQFAG